MINKKQVAITDIYQDARIPIDVYRPTFVKSLVMTPVRQDEPIAAIGTYWAKNHVASQTELSLLQSLADATSMAIENINNLHLLKQRVLELEATNHQLNRLTWIISHDLKEPFRGIGLNAQGLTAWRHLLPEEACNNLHQIISGVEQAKKLMDSLFDISRINSHKLVREAMDLNLLLDDIKLLCKTAIDESKAQITSDFLPKVEGDRLLVGSVLQNLISNACKFIGNAPPKIHIQALQKGARWEVSVQDNGPGIAKAYHEKVFDYFFRGMSNIPGSGVGLAICKKIITDLGGEIWVESELGQGSCFIFTLQRAMS